METKIIETLTITDRKVQVRIEDAKRHAEVARNAAKTAREKGKEAIAKKLEADADELENLAATWAQDTLDDGPESHAVSGGGSGKESSNNKNKSSSENGGNEETAGNEKTGTGEAGEGSESKGGENQNSGGTSSNNTGLAGQAGNQTGQSGQSGNQSGNQASSQSGNQSGQNGQSGSESGTTGQETGGNQSGQGSQSGQQSGQEGTSSQSGSQSGNQSGNQSGQQQNGQQGQQSGQESGQQQGSQSGGQQHGQQQGGSKPNKNDSGWQSGGSEQDEKNAQNQQNQNNDNEKGLSKLNLDDDGEGSSDSNNSEQVKDIFGMKKPSMQQPQNGQMPQQPPTSRDPTIDEIKQMLGRLSGEAKRGALAGIRDLLKNKPAAEEADNTTTESLHEKLFSKNNIREIDDDEWADKLNSILQTAQDLGEPIKVLDDKEKIDRLHSIKQMMTDPIIKKELEKEANVDISKDYQKKKALEDEGKQYRNYRSISAFKINFYNAIKDQVENIKQEYQGYEEVNAEYEGEDIILKADLEREIPDEAIPIVNLYFDRSSSWHDGHSIDIGKQIVATIQQFADAGEIKLNVLYFDNYVTPDEEDAGLGRGGTNAWPDIIQNILATKANNVVLMTDKDMEYDAKRQQGICRVNGCVWIIWRLRNEYDTGGQEIPRKLVGSGYNGQFAFKGNEKY